MRYRSWLVFGLLTILSLAGSAGAAWAQMEAAYHPVVGDSSTLTVDVIPLQAEVRLNGAPIGNAHYLTARPIAVVPGHHVLEVLAPGYLTARVDVSATPDWATRIWLQLVPDRGQ